VEAERDQLKVAALLRPATEGTKWGLGFARVSQQAQLEGEAAARARAQLGLEAERDQLKVAAPAARRSAMRK